MSTNYVELKVETCSTKVTTPAIESEPLLSAPIQTEFPGEDTLSPEDTPQGRNSKLVGFERGAMRLQQFVGPKQF